MRPRRMLLLAAAAGVLAGCQAAPLAKETASPGASVSATGPHATTSRPAGRPTTPSRTAAPVVTRDGPCPYFVLAYAQETIGQHLARSTVTTTRPYPGCTLYRPDGGKAIEIQVSAFPSAVAAQRRAVTVLGPSANPTSVGDRATVAIVADGTRLAASKGRYLVTVYINQQSSLQAHDVAIAVANKIH